MATGSSPGTSAVASKHNGWRRVPKSAIIEYAALANGKRRLEIGGATLVTEGGSPTTALLFGAGNSKTRVDSDTASARFINFYLQNSAATGFQQGLSSASR